MIIFFYNIEQKLKTSNNYHINHVFSFSLIEVLLYDEIMRSYDLYNHLSWIFDVFFFEIYTYLNDLLHKFGDFYDIN